LAHSIFASVTDLRRTTISHFTFRTGEKIGSAAADERSFDRLTDGVTLLSQPSRFFRLAQSLMKESQFQHNLTQLQAVSLILKHLAALE
jgi:hypothetical protein